MASALLPRLPLAHSPDLQCPAWLTIPGPQSSPPVLKVPGTLSCLGSATQPGVSDPTKSLPRFPCFLLH